MESNVIISQREPNSPVSESYRNIRSSILFSNVDNNIKKIMVTSSTKGEGKSTTTINIAYSMSELGKRVILIDCDLRKASLHKKLRLSNQIGLTDLLLNKDSYKGYVQKYTDNLHILTSGRLPKNPSEVIASKTMQSILDEIAADYDYIFLDCAPMMVTDPVLMSSITDGVIYVIESGETEIEIAQRCIQKLKAANANILGCILNKIDKKTMSYGYGYYYYSYYTDDEGTRHKKKSKR